MRQGAEVGSKNRVLVTGATGLVGRRLLPLLSEQYAAIRTLSRSGPSARSDSGSISGEGVEACRWDGDRIQNKADSADAVLQMLLEYLQGERELNLE